MKAGHKFVLVLSFYELFAKLSRNCEGVTVSVVLVDTIVVVSCVIPLIFRVR